jgi:hypothetical protein
MRRAALLACHRDLEAFVGGDQVVEIFGGVGDVELDPLDGTGEVAALRRVAIADR